jgi:hypothetical protein
MKIYNHFSDRMMYARGKKRGGGGGREVVRYEGRAKPKLEKF